MSPFADNRTKRFRAILTIVTFFVLAIVIYAARHQIGQTIENLGKVNTFALLLIIPLQVLNYHCYTQLYRGVFAVLDVEIGYRAMYRISLEINFVNNVFPSGGISTFSYFGSRMRDYKVPATKSTLIQLMRFVLVFISFQVLLILGLLLLAINGKANDLMLLITGSIATLLFVMTVSATFVLKKEKRIHAVMVPLTKAFNSFVGMFRRGKPDLISIDRVKAIFSEVHDNYQVLAKNYKKLKRPLIYSLFANLTEVLTLYAVYIAFDQWVNPGAVIIGYAIANFAGVIAIHLPGGVGVYEGLMTGVMAAAGVPPGISLPATIMYRILAQTIQLPPGFYFYNKFVNAKPAKTASP